MTSDASGTLYYTTSDGIAKLLPGSAPQMLSAGGAPVAIALDATHAYFTGNGNLGRVILAGGTAESLVQKGVSDNSLAESAGTVFYYTTGLNGSIAAYASPGGTQTTLAVSKVFQLTADDKYVYWTHDVNPGPVRKLPIGGGEVIDAAVGARPRQIVADGKMRATGRTDLRDVACAERRGGAGDRQAH
jgi:hypothetical protein